MGGRMVEVAEPALCSVAPHSMTWRPLSLILKGHNSHQGPPEGSEAEAGTKAGSPDPSRPLPVLRGEVCIWGVGSWELGVGSGVGGGGKGHWFKYPCHSEKASGSKAPAWPVVLAWVGRGGVTNWR